MGRVAFLGSKDIGLAVLQTLADSKHELAAAVCYDDREDPRSQLEELRRVAEGAGAPARISGGDAEWIPWLEELSVDLVVVSGWYRRIPVEELDGVGFFGFHAAPLPRYRGGAPLVWQIIRGEPEIGVSMFELTAELDQGGIVEQRSRPLSDDETIADALAYACEACAEMTSANLDSLIDGSAKLHRQDPARATYCSQRTPADGLIDWGAEARAVHNFVRAQTRPYPGAFCRLPDGRSLRVWRTELEPRSYVGPRGAVVERRPDAALVTCGTGAVSIVEAQVDGEPPAPVGEILSDLSIRLS